MPNWLKWLWPGTCCTLEQARKHFKMTDSEVKYIENSCKEYVHPCTEDGERVIYIVYSVWCIRWKLFVRRNIVTDDQLG